MFDSLKQDNSRINLFVGASLLFVGLAALADQYLRTGWLALGVLALVGLFFLLNGIRIRSMGWVIAGSIVSGLGMGAFLFFTSLISLSTITRIGLGLLAFALGWVTIFVLSTLLGRRPAWWALIPGGIAAGVGICFFFNHLRLLDFVLWTSAGLGIALLSWGIFSRLLGLIIPGCLVGAIGFGVYLAWSQSGPINGLVQTGIMLVVFALGWLLITVFSRMATEKFVWWPLIPGGVLAVTGWGLYSGGNPGGAVDFISNTGSIALIIFGLYLLLMRQGIHR